VLPGRFAAVHAAKGQRDRAPAGSAGSGGAAATPVGATRHPTPSSHSP
jgi:hypothetical protein